MEGISQWEVKDRGTAINRGRNRGHTAYNVPRVETSEDERKNCVHASVTFPEHIHPQPRKVAASYQQAAPGMRET